MFGGHGPGAAVVFEIVETGKGVGAANGQAAAAGILIVGPFSRMGCGGEVGCSGDTGLCSSLDRPVSWSLFSHPDRRGKPFSAPFATSRL
jgi:hypothetical protein